MNLEFKMLQFAATLRTPFFFPVTPFKFTATLNQSHNKSGLNMSLNKSAHKAKFDLAASLTRPMTWKPHAGKLKPFTAGTTSVHQRDVKAVKVTTK